MENSRGIGAVRPGSRGARSCWTFLRDALLVSLLAGCCAGQCDSCLEYCCEGAPPFCCSYYAYVGDVLSEWILQFFHEEAGEGWMFDYYSVGTAISGIVFGVVFLMGAVAAIFLCLCMCVKNGRNSRVGVFRACHVNTVAQGYRGPPPPYSYDYEMNPHHILPPPYTPTPPRTHPPPPPYPGYSSK